MDIQTRAPLYAWIAVIVAALSVATTSQEQSTASAHYTVFTRDGSEVDLGFARRWLDAAEELLATKYHVVPDRYHISVYLLHRPENDIDTTQSGQNRCCATDGQGRKTGTIFLLGPSAPVWKERPLVSSLGLPKDGLDYHAKVLMSEYIPIGHYAVQDSRQGRGWSYYSAPSWFVQGLQEYDAIYHTTDTNRTDTAARLMRWARQNQGRFACCAKGIDVGDVYNGGAAFMAFLASTYGEGIHERILRSEAKTFDEALADQTSPLSRSELFDRFRAWVRDTK
jgi:hypothetical protein